MTVNGDVALDLDAVRVAVARQVERATEGIDDMERHLASHWGDRVAELITAVSAAVPTSR
ncbi:hypothetical protein ACFOW4_02505 [Micromonospora sp. GCM10011542]|uniref:hypothetical protein n=1 Tax=Micromonospora sp. GCM10011542 TaxID=3317337 RepID=UPI00362441BE